MNIAPSTIGRRYGFHRSPLPNARLRAVHRVEADVVFPPKFDLLAYLTAVKDQGQEGSCTANSACGAKESLDLVMGTPALPRSRQLLYFLERKDQGSAPDDDSGSSISESVAAMESYGLALESDWPYDPRHFSLEPTPEILTEAANDKVIDASDVAPDINSIKSSIFDRRVVMFGFTVFESFESPDVASSGLVPMPQQGEQVLGGHAVYWGGWDDDIVIGDSKGALLFRNSWSERWGQGGNAYMPYDYVLQNLASDFHRLNR